MKKQPNNKILKEDDIDLFYRILCTCSLSSKLTGFNTREKWFNKWENKIVLNVTNNVDENICCPLNTINYKTATFRNHLDNKRRKTSTIGSLLIRLRNSFAHCNIEYSGGNFILKDYNMSHAITMYGKVNQELLRNFIDDALNNRKIK